MPSSPPPTASIALLRPRALLPALAPAARAATWVTLSAAPLETGEDSDLLHPHGLAAAPTQQPDLGGLQKEEEEEEQQHQRRVRLRCCRCFLRRGDSFPLLTRRCRLPRSPPRLRPLACERICAWRCSGPTASCSPPRLLLGAAESAASSCVPNACAAAAPAAAAAARVRAIAPEASAESAAGAGALANSAYDRPLRYNP